MMMSVIWVCMIMVSLIFSAATGNAEATGKAALEGAAEAVSLCISIGGMMCLWSGVMEVMRRSGMAASIAKSLRPVLGKIFPEASKDSEIMENLSGNVSANLLGLGNAATPLGIKSAQGILKQSRGKGASDELCRLVVMNSASIQILPTTIAGIRGMYGAQSAFDILPAVWISSAAALAVGLAACFGLSGRDVK